MCEKYPFVFVSGLYPGFNGGSVSKICFDRLQLTKIPKICRLLEMVHDMKLYGR